MSLLMRRRMLLTNAITETPSLLPKEYQQVEYIQSTGTQYIDIGIIPTPTSKLDTTAQFIGDYNSDNIYLCGIATGTGRFAFGHYPSINRGKFTFIIGNKNLNSFVMFDTNVHRFIFQGDGYRCIDYTENYFNDLQFEGQYTVPIFAGLGKNGIGYYCSMRVYAYKFYDNYETNNLVRDLIPCYRKSDNVIGLYDLVYDKFYTNQGTGTFLKGADI